LRNDVRHAAARTGNQLAIGTSAEQSSAEFMVGVVADTGDPLNLGKRLQQASFRADPAADAVIGRNRPRGRPARCEALDRQEAFVGGYRHGYAGAVNPPLRAKILITGASSGLGAGMARTFAAMGRDLALCARRTDKLDELRAELTDLHPEVRVAVAALDVNDHDQVPEVFAALRDELDGIDRVIVNAGIGKGAALGSGKLWANKLTLETNLIAALVQIEVALQMFNEAGSGHLVLISSVLGARGVPGVRAAYAASKAGLTSLGESLNAEYASNPINITTIEPGYIQSEMTAKADNTRFIVDSATGVRTMVDAIEREPGRATVPRWPWAPLVQLIRILPPHVAARLA